MKTKTRKFKINDKVRFVWPEKQLERFGLDRVAIVRRFGNDYDKYHYYVSNPGSLVLWLAKESDIRKVGVK